MVDLNGGRTEGRERGGELGGMVLGRWEEGN